MQQAMSTYQFTPHQFISGPRFLQPVARSKKPNFADNSHDDSILLGESMAVHRLRSQIRRIAPHFRTALIRGEIGSGRQLVARAVHALSPCSVGPFIVTTGSELVDSLTGGSAAHPTTAASLLESALGGTLYLGDVGELSFGQQQALLLFLRACEGHRAELAAAIPTQLPRLEARPSGVQNLNVRILASTDRNLRTLSAVGRFRQDLYARLSGVEIVVPPLRERIEDIPMLAAWLLRRTSERSGLPPKLLAEETLTQLQECAWPGNLRELERVITQAAALAEGNLIKPRHLLAPVEPRFVSPPSPPAVKLECLHDVILRHVLEILTRCSGNKVRAAEVLGISRSTLYRMLGTEAPSESPRT
jgi:DNA-binding NtrC family response regulator